MRTLQQENNNIKTERTKTYKKMKNYKKEQKEIK